MSFTSNNDSNLPAPGTGVEMIATTGSSKAKEEDQLELDLDIDTEVPFTFGDDSSNQAQATSRFGIARGSSSCIKIILGIGIGVTAATLAFFGTTMKVANHNDVISTNSAAAFDSASSKSSKSPRPCVKSPKSSKSGGGGGGGGGGCGSGVCSPDPLNSTNSMNCLYDLVGPGECEDSAGGTFAYIALRADSECECAQICNECVNGKVIGGDGGGLFRGFSMKFGFGNSRANECNCNYDIAHWSNSYSLNLSEACRQLVYRADDTCAPTVGPITNSSGVGNGNCYRITL